MTDIAIDIKKLVDQLDGFPAATRDGILNALLAAKAEREKHGDTVLLTPAMSAARDTRHAVMIRQLRAQCARVGYNLRDDRTVDLVELNKALKESSAPDHVRWALKTHLAQLSLIR